MKYLVGVAVLAIIDLAAFSTWVAIFVSVATLALSAVAFWEGHRAGRVAGSSEAVAWRLLAEERGRELEQRGDGTHRGRHREGGG